MKFLLIRGGFAAVALTLAIAPLPATAALAAAPIALAAPASFDSYVLQVRDGCGRGYRYSNRRERCVEDFDDRRGPPVRRGPPPDPGVAIMQGIIGGVVIGPDRRLRGCPRNMRWSDRHGACVYN